MPRDREREKALPVGLFVLLGVILLIAGALWLQGFVLQPRYIFTVIWQRADIINNGLAVYFRGVHVGRIISVELSPDNDHTVVQVGITYPSLRVPSTSQVFVRSEGFTGQRYLEIVPPKSQVYPKKYLASRGTLQGSETTTINDIISQVGPIIRSRQLEKIFDHTQEAMVRFSHASGSIEQLSKHGDRFLSHIEGPSKRTLQKIQQTSNSTQETLALLSHAGISLQRAGDRADKTFAGVQQQLQQTQVIPDWAHAAKQVSRSANRLGDASNTVQQQLQNSDLIQTASQTFRNLNAALVGSYSGTRSMPANKIEQLNQLLDQLNQASAQLRDNVSFLQTQRLFPQMDNQLTQLSNLAIKVQEMVKSGKATIFATGDVQQVRAQLDLFQNIGNQIVADINIMQPTLKAQITGGSLQSRNAASNLLAALTALSSMGHDLTNKALQLKALLTNYNQTSTVSGQSQYASMGWIGAMSQFQHTISEYDCLSRQMDDILNSRFLGFRLFFGKLGHDNHCSSWLPPKNPPEKPGGSTAPKL